MIKLKIKKKYANKLIHELLEIIDEKDRAIEYLREQWNKQNNWYCESVRKIRKLEGILKKYGINVED